MLTPTSLLLFGGCASGFGPCPLSDLWRLDDATTPGWSELTITGPSPRTHPTISAIGSSESALLFGGSASGNQNDLWLLDALAPSWQRITTAGTPPSARDGHAAVWLDSTAGDACGQLIVFGGTGAGGDRADLWTLASTAAAAPDPLLYAIRVATGVELSWTTSLTTPAWEVWRGIRPDFLPGDADATLLTAPIVIVGTTATIRDEPLAPGDYFWKARGIGCP